MNVKERIQKYLDAKGIRTTTFEKEVGLSNGYWRKTKSISANILTDILKKYTDLSSDYVLGISEMMCCSSSDPDAPFRDLSPSVSGNGLTTDSQRTHSGGTTEELRKENTMLKELLAEKERTIQILLERSNKQ